MNPGTQNPTAKTSKKRNAIIVSLIIFILLMLVVTAQLTYTIFKYDKMYKGIYVNGIDISNLSRPEAESLLQKHFKDDITDMKITLKADRYTEEFCFKDIGVVYDIQKAVNDAYSIGRTGSIFNRAIELLKSGKKIRENTLSAAYDMEKLNSIVQDIYDKTLITVKQPDLLIQDDQVIIYSGSHGESVDKVKIASDVENLIDTCKGGTIEIPTIITEQGHINIDNMYNQISREPANASFMIENNNVAVVPQVTGRNVDKVTLASIVSDIEKTEDTEKNIPITVTSPEISTDAAQAALFRDTLATKTTHFSTSTVNDSNRGENIRLAVSKINGKILAPGEIFSFNETVGKRTIEDGYREAHVYIGGKVVDGVGGGICQVSSTLYNSVLYSDLEVVERRNHMFTVGYVPKGLDATVSYGTTDFRFKNSTRWPIKIKAEVSKSNDITFTLIGTNENPGKKIEMIPEIIKTIPYSTKYFDDPTLPEGQTKVRQSGKNGYVVDTYKIVKQDGKVISRTKIHTSTYSPLEEEILRGTKKVDSTDITPSPTPTPPQIEGVDDADNPPAPPTEEEADGTNNPSVTQPDATDNTDNPSTAQPDAV